MILHVLLNHDLSADGVYTALRTQHAQFVFITWYNIAKFESKETFYIYGTTILTCAHPIATKPTSAQHTERTSCSSAHKATPTPSTHQK